MSQDKVDLLQRTVAKGTSNDEFALFMHVCQNHGLDPFVKQIYCVMFPVSKHHKDDKGIWVAGEEMVIITGIGGYRKMAARDHKDYAGSSDAEFTWFDPPQKTPAGRDMPRSATIKIFRRGAEPTVATVYWEEFAPADLKTTRADFWNRTPKNQLEKCAEAKGLRKAFPGLGDVFTDVELSQRMSDITEGGREIVQHDGTAPSGRIVDSFKHGRIEAQRTASEKLGIPFCEKHGCPETLCPSDEHTLEHNEAVTAREGARRTAAREKAAPPQTKAAPVPTQAPPANKGMVEVDWTIDPKAPRLLGDLDSVIDQLKAKCTVTWGNDGFWHVLPKDVIVIKAICQPIGLKVQETLHALNSQVPGSRHGLPAKPTAENRAESSPSPPAVVSGTIDLVNSGMAGKAPVKYVTLILANGSKPSYGCFDKKYFDALEAGRGKKAEFILETRGKYTNILRVVKIGSKEFDEHGVPIIQNKIREAGGKTLF
jgi:phage recombination protein Bet